MKKHYSGLKMKKMPLSLLKYDFEKDILPAEERLINEFGFLKEEIDFVMKKKGKFILFEKQRDEGFLVVLDFFVKKLKFDIDVLRTLVVKYPFILGKSQEHFE
jgi:hypothetical protein